MLLVWGRQDVMVFQTGAERVLDAVEHSELVTIEDCGHCPQLEAPDRLLQLLLDFPSSLARAACHEADTRPREGHRLGRERLGPAAWAPAWPT